MYSDYASRVVCMPLCILPHNGYTRNFTVRACNFAVRAGNMRNFGPCGHLAAPGCVPVCRGCTHWPSLAHGSPLCTQRLPTYHFTVCARNFTVRACNFAVRAGNMRNFGPHGHLAAPGCVPVCRGRTHWPSLAHGSPLCTQRLPTYHFTVCAT